MSILIKGATIPKDIGYLHLCLHADGRVITDYTGGWEDYKAIELPPHGRLIDADELIKQKWESSDWASGGVHEIVVSVSDILDAPIIIEAEREDG